MSQITVLVGFAEAMSAPEVVWSLVDAGFRVAAFARKGRASALRYSRHVHCYEIYAPEVDLHASISDLQLLLSSFDSQIRIEQFVLFPLDDKAVWLCDNLVIPEHWLLAGPRESAAALALNKDLQIAAACDAGFSVPKTVVVRTVEDLLAVPAEVPYPVILKPVECVPIYDGQIRSSKKWICANETELRRVIAEWDRRIPLLVQEFLTGVGEGVFGIAAPEGIRAWSAHRRVRMMNPQGSGSSACISQLVPDEIKRCVEAFITKAQWRGLFMIELLRDKKGKLWFVELNGRPWGSTALCRRQGLEYPAWNVALAVDHSAPCGITSKTEPGVVCRHAGREFMHLLFVLRGAKSKALAHGPSFWRSLVDILSIRKKDGLYNWRRDDLRVFAADFYYTIHDNVFKSAH